MPNFVQIGHAFESITRFSRFYSNKYNDYLDGQAAHNFVRDRDNIPAKAFARDYGITGVGLSVCLSVCYHDN